MDRDSKRIYPGLILVSGIVILHNAFKSWNKRLCEHDCNDLCVFVHTRDRKSERTKQREGERVKEKKQVNHSLILHTYYTCGLQQFEKSI